MTTDPIAAARALIEPLTGYTPGPWVSKESKWSEEQIVQAGMPSNRVLACFDGDGEGADEQSLSDARLIAAAPDLRDMVATLADAMETVTAIREKVEAERDHALTWLAAGQKENERLRESLRRISSPQYGLQGLIEDGASEGEITQYWANLASGFATTARIALRNPTAATPDPDARAALLAAMERCTDLPDDAREISAALDKLLAEARLEGWRAGREAAALCLEQGADDYSCGCDPTYCRCHYNIEQMRIDADVVRDLPEPKETSHD